jgi:hypothetical protein
VTQPEQVDRLLQALDSCVGELLEAKA